MKMSTAPTKASQVHKKSQPSIKQHAGELVASTKTDRDHPKKNEEIALLSQEIKLEDLKTTCATSSLPDPATTHVHPDEYLLQLVEALHGYRPVVQPCLSLENDFFPDITQEQLAAYDLKVVSAARENDMDLLRSFYQERGRKSMSGCNRFGESILHLACRRGFEEMVNFLLADTLGPQLSVCIRDDCGRTPFHDACWNPQVQLKICSLLVERDATLLLLSDKRGHTPFQYARQEHWPTWRKFLFSNRKHLQQALGEKRNKEIFS